MCRNTIMKSIYFLSTFINSSFLLLTESPTNIVVQRVGDQGDNSNQNVQVAAAGEDLELECISTGANPPAKLKWYMMKPDSTLEEIPNGHSQDNRRADNARTWSSISRLNLPISKDDNKGKIKCIAEHPALHEELAAETSLIIHCEYSDAFCVL